jgi:hypothetical protein
MEAFRHHVYVRDRKKPEGAPSCTANGSARVIEALRAEVARRGMSADVRAGAHAGLTAAARPAGLRSPVGAWSVRRRAAAPPTDALRP